MLLIRDSAKIPRKGSKRIIIKLEEEIAERHAMPYHANDEVELFITKKPLSHISSSLGIQ